MDKRMYVHGHNGLSGSASLMKSNALRIINADSTTQEAKDIAASIMALADDLKEALKTRIDPE